MLLDGGAGGGGCAAVAGIYESVTKGPEDVSPFN